MIYQCPRCTRQCSARKSFRMHLIGTHDIDMRQTRKFTGTKFDNVDEIYQPDPATLERLKEWWRRSHRMGGPRSRTEQRRCKRAAAVEATSAPPPKTSVQAATSSPAVRLPLDATALSESVTAKPSVSVSTKFPVTSTFQPPLVFSCYYSHGHTLFNI